MVISPKTKKNMAEDAAKLVKLAIGRGPKNIYVSAFNNRMSMTLVNTLTPLEEQFLAKTDNRALVKEIRSQLITCLHDDWCKLFSQYGFTITDIEGDIDLEQDQRILNFTLKE